MLNNAVFVSLPLYGKLKFGNLILDWSTNNIEHQCILVSSHDLHTRHKRTSYASYQNCEKQTITQFVKICLKETQNIDQRLPQHDIS